MNKPNGRPPKNGVDGIRREIEKLSDEQIEALKAATFLGMTDEEAVVHDERRDKINQLYKALRLLRDAAE